MPKNREKEPEPKDKSEKPRNDGTLERQERSEVLLRFLDSAENIEPFRGKKFEEIFSNEEQKRTFIDGLKPAEFTELLNGINGILRDKEKEEWGMDGESVVIESPLLGVDYVPSKQEDKPELLTETLSSAKAMNENERTLEDIALLISSSLNAIHPYADANGRMSRLIYSLISKDFNSETKPELKQVLSEYGRDKVNIDPRLIREEIEDLIEDEVGIKNPEKNPDNITNLWIGKLGKSLEYGEKIDENDKRLFSELYDKDSRYLFWSVFKYLQDNPGLEKEKYINKFPKRAAIVADRLCKDLTQEGMTQMLQNYRSLKKEYVEKLIDCIAHPEKKEYQVEYGGQQISLKDYFKLRIEEEAEKIAKEDKEQLGWAREEAKEAFEEREKE